MIKILLICFAAFAVAVVIGVFVLQWDQTTVLVSGAISAMVSATVLMLQRAT